MGEGAQNESKNGKNSTVLTPADFASNGIEEKSDEIYHPGMTPTQNIDLKCISQNSKRP